MRITLKQLEVFIAIAKTENMSQAAQTLHLTQSACSMALSTLEKQLNSILFDRHSKRLTLNERGRFLLPKAISVTAQAQEMQDSMMENNKETLAGHLIIGASLTIGNYLLPKIVGNFITLHPEVKISLKISNTESIIQQLLKFDIDMAVVEGSCHYEEIEALTWGKDELVIITAPNHPLARKDKVTRADLINSRWILRESGSGTREHFDTAFGGKIEPFLELGHHEAIKQAVKNGLGISCLSKITIAQEIKNQELVILKTPFLKLTRNFYLLRHKNKYQTALLHEFIKTSKPFFDHP